MNVRHNTVSYHEVSDYFTEDEFFDLRYNYKKSSKTINESYNSVRTDISNIDEKNKIINFIKLFDNYKHTEQLINKIYNDKYVNIEIIDSMNIFSNYSNEIKKKIINNLDINDVIFLTENTTNLSNKKISLYIENLIFENISSRKLRN